MELIDWILSNQYQPDMPAVCRAGIRQVVFDEMF